MRYLESFFSKLLAEADVELNGTRPWDIQVNDPAVYRRVLLGGTKALGDAYVRGDWNCSALDELVYRICRSGVNKRANSHFAWRLHDLIGHFVNYGSGVKAFVVGQRHYDLGNDLYKATLDESMTYTCGIWLEAESLAQAQRNKNDLVCQKLGLLPGQKLLDIGSGWGALANHAARNYKVQVMGISVSKKQVAFANRISAGLPVKHLLQNYRDLRGSYDAAASVEMIEAVGYKNVRTYFQKVHQALKPNSLFVLQAIVSNVSTKSGNPWLNARIFPGGMLLSLSQIAEGSEGLFSIEDIEEFTPDYDRTLMAWDANFERNWPKIKGKYGSRFYRMWRLYLLSCAGSFRAKNMRLCQFVFSRNS